MKATLLMTTFKRDALLIKGLQSIRRYSDVDILVLDEAGTHETKYICKDHDAKYFLTKSTDNWRIPGFALNIGVRNIDSDIIILSCPEIYHLDDCLNPMIETVENNPMSLAVPIGKDDKYNEYNYKNYNNLHTLITRMPFLMALRRSLYVEMRGYDEDYVGAGSDDTDFVDRLQAHGCELITLPVRCVHLYHDRRLHRAGNLHEINREIYKTKNPKDFVRNLNREWGRAYA